MPTNYRATPFVDGLKPDLQKLYFYLAFPVSAASVSAYFGSHRLAFPVATVFSFLKAPANPIYLQFRH